jgi:hypothetical protein
MTRAATLLGGALILWSVNHDTQSPRTMSFGVSLFVLGFAAFALCLGRWLVSGGNHRPRVDPLRQG